MNFSIRQTAFTEFTKLTNHVCEHTAYLVNMQFMSCTLSSCTGILGQIPRSSASFSPSEGFRLAIAVFLHSCSGLLLLLSLVMHHMVVLNRYLGWATLSITWNSLEEKVL